MAALPCRLGGTEAAPKIEMKEILPRKFKVQRRRICSGKEVTR